MADGGTQLRRILRERFRLRSLDLGKQQVLDLLLTGHSALLVAPEGHGKSLCWQVATAVRGGPVLVIAASSGALPRRAERLADRPGLVACHLDAARPPAVTAALREQIAAGRYDAVLVSARQLGDPRVREAALASRPWLVVVEDADRVSPWGRVLDPSYARIADLLSEFDDPTVLALADVACPRARDDVTDRLRLQDTAPIDAGMDRAELRIEVRNTPGQATRDAHLLAVLGDRPERAVVFVSLRVDAERLAVLIEETCELPVEAVHGGMGPGPFADAMRRFREGGARVLVATGALGRDERWPAVPLVVHYALPHGLGQYHRQMMLAEADGEPARSVLLYDRDERPLLERAAWRCAPEPGHLLAMHRAVVEADGKRLTYATLSRDTGLHPDEAHVGVEALAKMGALVVSARGDDWVEAAAGPLPATGLADHARHADALRRVRLAQAEQVIEYARARRCRRAFLAQALGYEPASDPPDCCDRCAPAAEDPRPRMVATGYPIRAGDCRGWALSLYRRPGEEVPTDVPARLLHALKYDGDLQAAPRLAYLMARRVRERPKLRECQVIVPIPPTDPEDETSPAVLLATGIARLTRRPLVPALVRATVGAPQKELASRGEKESNIEGAFEAAGVEAVRGRIVLLVDDVFDSGATMDEAANALRRSGAADVRLLAAVRTTFGWRSDV